MSSTWGQLRLVLQVGAPGLSPDLLDSYLNSRYEQILEKTDWTGLKYHVTLITQAAYQSSTDSVTVTVGSAAVVGVGTAWTVALVGQRFYVPGTTVIYTVTTFLDATHLTIDRPYEGVATNPAGTLYAGSQYVLMQHIYSLPSDARSVTTILNPVTGQPLQSFTKTRLDESVGTRTLVADPAAFAPYDDSSEANPPVFRQIEFYPPPLQARGYPVEYLHAAQPFDGTNTASSPLPFVSDSVLLAGCRADICAGQKDYPGVAFYTAEWNREVAALLLVEHKKRPATAVHMAERFTRHRMQRAQRGLSRNWGAGQGGPN